MKRMVKWIALLSAAAMLLAACGGAAAPSTPATLQSSTPAASEATGASEAANSGGDASASSGSLTKVNLSEVVHSLFYTPQYVALSQGYFKDEGLDVNLTTAQGSDKGATELLSGQADIALIGPETGLYILSRGTDKPLRLFAELTATDGSLLVCKGKGSYDTFKWESLKGKTIIGNRPGSSPEVVLEAILKKHGLTPGKDVTVVTNLGNATIPAAFKSGKQDCAEMWEPVPEQFEANGWGYVAASPGAAMGRLPYTAFLATQTYIDAHPQVIQAFTDAVYRALQFTYHAPIGDVVKAVQPFFPDVDASLLQKSITRYRSLQIWTSDLSVTPEQLNNYEDLLSNAGQLKSKVAYQDYVMTKFWAQAKKDVSQ